MAGSLWFGRVHDRLRQGQASRDGFVHVNNSCRNIDDPGYEHDDDPQVVWD